MARKQQPNLSGLDDPNWLPLGPDLHVAQDLAGKGLRIAYRERGDPNCNLALLDPGRPPDQHWQQKEERFTPPAPRKRGRKPTADWKVHAAFYVGRIKGSEEELPTAAEIATWCQETLDYLPDISEINRLLKTLRV